MNTKFLLPTCFLFLAASLASPCALAAAPGVLNSSRPDGKPHQFTFGGENGEAFLLDGRPLQIRAGEIHPQRIPKEYWSHRIRMAKAMGLNTIAFYTFWNGFEQPDGSFDFTTGNRDIAGFIKLCQEEGMWTLFRPGPYACGEWDFGGIPARLLKHPDLKIRTLTDERFMEAQTRYLKSIAAVAAPFLAKNGGPILMTQLENEYGSYQRKEHNYMLWLRDFWTAEGFGPLFTADGPAKYYMKNAVVPGVAVGLDPGENERAWEIAREMNPGVPAFSSETYPGWIRHWGEGDWTPSNKDKVTEWYMEKGKSFNFYVVHGGTNFGFTAGANSGKDGVYQPDLTSYDYAAPISEQGLATPAYHRLRQIIAPHLAENGPLPEPPAAIPTMEIPSFTPVRIAGLHDLFPPAKPVAPDAMWFEAWEQNQGLALYTTQLPAGPAAPFSFENLNDYGQVYLDGKRLATIDRRLVAPKTIDIPARDKPATLAVVVEGMGHINFSIAMESDRKGLHGLLKLGDTPLTDWQVSPLPLADEVVTRPPVATNHSTLPGSHLRATFDLSGNPADTFFDMSKYEKGTLWVNGHNLGRFWKIGPQHRLYCPASWLRTGKNTVDIIDLEVTEPRPVRGCIDPGRDSKNPATRNANNEW